MIWIYLISFILLYISYLLYINTETYHCVWEYGSKRGSVPHVLKMWMVIVALIVTLIPFLNFMLLASFIVIMLMALQQGDLVFKPLDKGSKMYKVKEFLNREL